jgi:hypothetical protein
VKWAILAVPFRGLDLVAAISLGLAPRFARPWPRWKRFSALTSRQREVMADRPQGISTAPRDPDQVIRKMKKFCLLLELPAGSFAEF